MNTNPDPNDLLQDPAIGAVYRQIALNTVRGIVYHNQIKSRTVVRTIRRDRLMRLVLAGKLFSPRSIITPIITPRRGRYYRVAPLPVRLVECAAFDRETEGWLNLDECDFTEPIEITNDAAKLYSDGIVLLRGIGFAVDLQMTEGHF